MSPALRARPWQITLASMAAILVWWMLAVRLAYGGHWNALYCTGSAIRMPGWIESRETVYRVAGPVGYDGQWFHILAHNPLRPRECAPYLDAPRMRCQRILLPLSAWLLALGRFEWVDPAYFTVMLLWLAAGVWWTARLSELRGAPPVWGLAFLLLPSTLASIDRMLADGPLVAAAAGFFYFAETGRWRAAWMLAVAAPFIRETGLLLPAAAAAWRLWQRRWPALLAWLGAAIPFLLWIHSLRDLRDAGLFVWKGPFVSLWRAFTRPSPYPAGNWISAPLSLMDMASVAATACAAGLALAMIWRQRQGAASVRLLPRLAGALFAAAALVTSCFANPLAWDDFYSAARVFSPIFFVLLLDGLERGRPAAALAVLAPVTLRTALQLVSPAWRILKTAAGF